MDLQALVLALSSVVRPTSTAAVYAMLSNQRPARLLMAFIAAGAVISLTVGLGVVSLLGPAAPTTVSPDARAVVDLVLGAASLGYATGVLSGRLRRADREPNGRANSRFTRRLAELTPRGAAVLGVLTHLPGVIYLAALNAIALSANSALDAVVQVLIYNVLWYSLPGIALGFAHSRPEQLRTALGRIADWARRHERVILVSVFATLGTYLVVRGILAIT